LVQQGREHQRAAAAGSGRDQKREDSQLVAAVAAAAAAKRVPECIEFWKWQACWKLHLLADALVQSYKQVCMFCMLINDVYRMG
jgi:hypothetical protein